MDMTQAQRDELATRVKNLRIKRFGGSRKRAYVEAGVNAATWNKAENAESIAERSMVAIVGLLWPETGGDWQQLDPPLDQGGTVSIEEIMDRFQAVVDGFGKLQDLTDEDERNRVLDLIAEDVAAVQALNEKRGAS